MDSIGHYLIRITAVALLCAIAVSLMDKSKPQGGIIKLVAGIIITLTVISPMIDVKLNDFSSYLDRIDADGQCAVDEGTKMARSQLQEIIKSNAETYILDKANSMGLTIHAEVTLDDSDPPIPVGIEITGPISSYNKQRLQKIIAEELGIGEGSQIWN